MKLIFLLTVFVTTLSFLLPSYVYARSGCCSHHGGVCGCGCCDGSPLSVTCSPYYPNCNQPEEQVVLTPIPTSNYLPNYPLKQEKSSNTFVIGWLIAGGIGGFLLSKYLKNRDGKQ